MDPPPGALRWTATREPGTGSDQRSDERSDEGFAAGSAVEPGSEWWRQRRLWVLAAATAGCYAVGYPLALVAGSPAGWLLVGLGGVLLLAVGATVVRGLAGPRGQG